MNSIFKIFKKEIRETFRDKKSLMMMLVVPLFIPLIVIGLSALFDYQTSENVSEIKKFSFAYELSDVEKSILDELEVEVISGTEEELMEKLENDEINFFISKSNDKDPNKFIINHKKNTSANYLVENFIESYKTYVQSNYLASNGVDPVPFLNIVSSEENVIDEGEEEINPMVDYMVQYSFIFIIMAITISATYPATDATAGERERGTLETLLTFPVKSRDIILGKYLNITVSSIVTGILSLILAIISLAIAGNSFSIYEDTTLMLSLQSLIIAVIAIILYSLMISGLCIAIASKSKTFKEAQSALTPIQFISFFPSFIAFLLEVNNSFILSLIPFLNITLLFGDSVSGNLSIINVIGVVLSSILITAILLSVIIKQYKSEKVLFAR